MNLKKQEIKVRGRSIYIVIKITKSIGILTVNFLKKSVVDSTVSLVKKRKSLKLKIKIKGNNKSYS